MTILTDNTDEIIALSVVIPTVAVIGYQAVMGMDITVPVELALIIIGYYFGKRVNDDGRVE